MRGNLLKCKLFKKRSGMTMIELMVALALSILCTITLVYMTALKVNSQENVDKQSQYLAVNGFFSELYDKFKSCDVVEVTSEDDGSYISISLASTNGDSVIYTYSQESKEFRRNNMPMFECLSVNATKTANNLYVGVKMQDDKLLEFNAYR